MSSKRPTQVLIKQENREADELMAQDNVEREELALKIQEAMQDIVVDDVDLDNMTDAEYLQFLKIQLLVRQKVAASSSGDPDAGPDADVQICGAPADSSSAAPDVDEDKVPPEQTSK